MYTHTSDCLATVHELPSKPNNSASETFLQISGKVRSFDRIFVTGGPAWR
jgi:hypothetical protein